MEKTNVLHNIATNLKIYNPIASEHISPAIADISTFLMHNETIKEALIHYQFETIHLYKCHNGILWRIIVLMILWNSDYKAAMNSVNTIKQLHQKGNEKSRHRQFTYKR